MALIAKRSKPELALLAVLFILMLLATRLWAQDKAQDAPEEPALISGQIRYDVRVEGPQDADLRETILALSELLARRETGVPSRFALRRRVDRDLETFRQVMHSGAHYDAQITGEIEPGAGRPSLFVSIRIEDGPRYQLGEVGVDYVGTPPPKRPKFLVPQGPATGAAIKAIEQSLLDQLLELGHADVAVRKLTAVLNRPTQSVDVRLAVEAGPIVRIGAVSIKGLRDVQEAHARRLANIEEGELLTPSRIGAAETALAESGLFETINIAPTPGDGVRPVTIELGERLHRTIGGGVRWASDEGFGIKGFWRHRNYFGGGELVDSSLELAEIRQIVQVSYRQPFWERRDQALLLSLLSGHEDGEAFNESRFEATAAVEREFSPRFKGRLGIGVEWSNSDDGERQQESYLLGLPGALEWDYSDDLIDPTEGYRISVRAAPYVGLSDGFIAFGMVDGSGSLYVPLDDANRFVLAARARLGVTIGPSRTAIPPSKRFYAGGGGSIRGYGYQRVSPLNANGNPIGGKSVIELSGEMRMRVMEDIGVVAFVDSGAAFAGLSPRFDDDIAYAAGLGVRYYTGLGPIRLDVAVPLNRREGDEAFQIYVSLGQAF